MTIIDHKMINMSIPISEKISFTEKQGQYLAFIKMYIKLNKIPLAHTDFQFFFTLPRQPLIK